MQRASLWLLGLSAMLLLAAVASNRGIAAEPNVEGVSSREVRAQAVRSLPLSRFSPRTQKALTDVVNNPSFFRRMPTQQIQCDPQMLQFLVRRPEVLVNIWELMGITQVSAKRTTTSSFMADDGVGTQCQCDLVFSNDRMHIYYGNGDYSGSMTPRRVKGRCVCVLHTKDFTDPMGETVVAGTMDVFLKLDNFGADILTRTLGPFVGKTADYNFVETAKFVSQISQLCTSSPAAAQGLAMRLTNVDDAVRQEFAGLAAKIAANSGAMNRARQAASLQEHPDAEILRLSDSRSNLSEEALSATLEQGDEANAAADLPTAATTGSSPYGSYFDEPDDAAVVKEKDLSPNAAEQLRFSDQASSSLDEGAENAAQPPRWVQPQKPFAFMRR